MRRARFAPVGRVEMVLTAVATAVLTFVLTRGLLDWRPVDLRRVTVTLREGTALLGVIALISAALHTRVTDAHRVLFPGNTPRTRRAALTSLTGWTAGLMSAGALVGMIPALARALRAPADAGDWVALLAWFACLWFLVALAHVAFVLVRAPYSYVVAPLVTLVVATAPTMIDDLVLNNTGHSSLLAAPTWGMSSPSGPWSYSVLAMAARTLAFALAAGCLLAALGPWLEPAESWPRRAGAALAWLLPPLLVFAGSVAASPELMAPTRTATACSSSGGVQACVFALDEPVLPTMLGAATKVTDQVPPEAARGVKVVPSDLATGEGDVLLSTQLPASRDELALQTSTEVAAHLAGLPACQRRNVSEPTMSERSTQRWQTATEVQKILVFRAGLPDGASSQGLSTVTGAEFRAWWSRHQHQIEACELGPDDLEPAS